MRPVAGSQWTSPQKVVTSYVPETLGFTVVVINDLEHDRFEGSIRMGEHVVYTAGVRPWIEFPVGDRERSFAEWVFDQFAKRLSEVLLLG